MSQAGPACAARVYLVGAGPGSADLLTVRAIRLLEQASYVVHDALVSAHGIQLAAHAVVISAGRRAGRVSARQKDINQILVDCARKAGASGGPVVRLKGG